MTRWEAIWGEPKLKWSQQRPGGFLQNLLIKAAGISSWLTSFHYESQVLQSYFFSFFFLLLAPNSRVLKMLGRLFAFHFVPFSGSFCKSVLGSTFLRHISLPLVIDVSVSLGPCLAMKATWPLRFKAYCWLGSYPEHRCPTGRYPKLGGKPRQR